MTCFLGFLWLRRSVILTMIEHSVSRSSCFQVLGIEIVWSPICLRCFLRLKDIDVPFVPTICVPHDNGGLPSVRGMKTVSHILPVCSTNRCQVSLPSSCHLLSPPMVPCGLFWVSKPLSTAGCPRAPNLPVLLHCHHPSSHMLTSSQT